MTVAFLPITYVDNAMRGLLHSLEQVSPVTASFLAVALLAGVALGLLF